MDLQDDDSPIGVSTGPNQWLVVWYTDDTLGGTIGADYDILISRSTDNGATWTAPAALNSNAATDSGDDFDPVIAGTPGGTWIAAFYTDDPLGGTIGGEVDILFTTSAPVPVELSTFMLD